MELVILQGPKVQEQYTRYESCRVAVTGGLKWEGVRESCTENLMKNRS